MARRLMRAFTISAENSEALDALLEKPPTAPELRFLAEQINPQGEEPESLDDHDLRPSDYVALYELFRPVHRPSKFLNKLQELTWSHANDRKPEFATLYRLACDEPNGSSILKEAARRRKLNGRKKARSRTLVNVSRIADVLLTLGFAELQERAANLDSLSNHAKGSKVNDAKGSTRKDAGQSGHKLPLTRRRKAVTV